MRIREHNTVIGLVIVKNDIKNKGIIRTTFTQKEQSQGELIARTVPDLTEKARSTIRDIDPTVSEGLG